MSSSTKRARLRYADSIKDDTEIPDIYNKRRKKAQKVRDRIDLDNDGAFADFEIDDLAETTVIDEAFDTYNTMKYFIYNAPLPTTSHMKNFPSNLPRICFLHQLYSVLPDNTAVDRELDILVQNLIVRKFRIGGTLEDELVIMFMIDYMAEILNAKAEFEADVEKEEASTKTKSVHSDLFDRFRQTVSSHKFTDVVISGKALRNIAGFSETEISQLVIYGLLVVHTQETYLFAIRRAGAFMNPFIKGRVEILRSLKRRQTRDILEKQLRTKKLRNSIFSHDFHLHDLLGSGRVERQKTTMGDLIKLTRKGEACL